MAGQTEGLTSGVITVVKAAGPGWLVIAETYEDGRYRTVRELFGDEPVTDEILQFIHRLPARLAKIQGAEIALKKPLEEQRRLSPKRAAREAARELAEARDPGRFQPTKSMRLEKAEFELSHATAQNFREFELTVWVRYGKKHCALLEEKHEGCPVVEVSATASDPDSRRQIVATLSCHYATDPARVELLHGYNTPRKIFKLAVPA